MVVGVFQFIALLGQAYFLNRSIREMQDTTRATREAVAVYRQYVTIAEGSNAITRQATELTRKSFILAERPKIIVRNVAVDDVEMLFKRDADAQITGTIFVANVGTTKAHIISIGYDVFRGVLPMVPPYAKSDGSKVDIELAPGKGTTWPFETVLPQPTDPQIYREITDRSAGVHVLGRIGYQDDIGTMRSTAICRRWDMASARFLPVNDPDYEHAE